MFADDYRKTSVQQLLGSMYGMELLLPDQRAEADARKAVVTLKKSDVDSNH